MKNILKKYEMTGLGFFSNKEFLVLSIRPNDELAESKISMLYKVNTGDIKTALGNGSSFLSFRSMILHKYMIIDSTSYIICLRYSKHDQVFS